METFSLTPEGLDCVDLEEGSGKNVDVSHLCLLGRILAPKPLNRQAVIKIVQRAWRPRAKVIISHLPENTFLFQFDDVEDQRRVLLEAPWSVMGHLLVLQPLSVGKSAAEMEFQWCPFWVQVHGIPVTKMTRQNGEIIGHRIGRLIGVKAMHDSLLLYRSFLCIRVEVDVSKPLPLGFLLQQKGPATKDTWISYKVGHEKSACKFVSREEGAKLGYGSELRTGRAPKLAISDAHIHHWVDMAEERVQCRGRNSGIGGQTTAPTVMAEEVEACSLRGEQMPNPGVKQHCADLGLVNQVSTSPA
ncbi:hypothetical protein ACSBR1_029880 [Camellia fascicularis]